MSERIILPFIILIVVSLCASALSSFAPQEVSRYRSEYVAEQVATTATTACTLSFIAAIP